jgi:hypothetical protein
MYQWIWPETASPYRVEIQSTGRSNDDALCRVHVFGLSKTVNCLIVEMEYNDKIVYFDYL